MLLVTDFFKTFTGKPVAGPSIHRVLVALSCDSRAHVDELVARARRRGAWSRAARRIGWRMYSRTASRTWTAVSELVYMEPGAVPPQA